ncbi:transposase, partial [Mordavella massiliensis]
LPETLCIDEFNGNSGIWSKKHHRWYRNKYHCNVSDGDAHAVIDILDQTSGVYLAKYFRQFSKDQREHVKYFCCDMSNGFVSMAKSVFPRAKICIDPFHVVQRLNKMADDVRKRYQHQFQDTGDTESYKKVKGIIRLLKTSEFNQVSYWGSRYNENRQRLKDAFEVAP